MLGIDTNVLVRFLLRDDEAQFQKANKLIQREVTAGRGVLVSQLVLLETEWVLRSRYGFSKIQLLEVIASLLDTRDIQLEDEQSVEEAIYQWKEANADFADCLIAARHRRLGCSATATFDARAVKLTGFVAV
ncbi:MAG: type II toxin-antitoxin system VapC family toxin [Betaproteobacteria bacterium]